MNKYLCLGLVVLIVWAFLSVGIIRNQSNELDAIGGNLLEMESKNKDLMLRHEDMVEYLKQSDTKQAEEIRQLTDAFNVKLKNVEAAQVQTIRFVDREIPQEVIKYDTVYVDTLGYKTRPFSINQECYSLAGGIQFTDTTATLELDSIAYQLDVVSVKYAKRKWYNPRTWFKPDVAEISGSTCGSINYTKINVAK